jgi:ATP-dependent DNA helicase PIF1
MTFCIYLNYMSIGVAAFQLKGHTLHSYSGLGLAFGSTKRVVDMAMRKNTVVQRWRRTDVLIIDEISMVHADLLDKVDRIARAARGIDAPFGGIQVIFCGDFFQLPPGEYDT